MCTTNPSRDADRFGEVGSALLSPGWTGRALHFHSPVAVVRALNVEEVAEALRRVEEAAQAGRYAVGYVAYEAAAGFEEALPGSLLAGPLVWFAIYDNPREAGHALEAMGLPSRSGDFRVTDVQFGPARAEYLSRVAAVKDYIRDGDVYQVNYTGRLDFQFEGDPRELFLRLLRHQPVPYAAYLNAGERHVLSCSPELFFERTGDTLRTRPMKGTARRGATLEEDAHRARALENDPKNRAENLMIVDLLRNDLSRCCVPGSVQVPRLFETEIYTTLIQMISEVRGTLRPGTGLADVFEALFPCGSVTGAPKIQAMKRIDELENDTRGIYCGAVGIVRPGGDAVFNVAIRTAELEGSRGRLGIGSGIVWDSHAETEYDECLLKAKFFTDLADSAATTPARKHASPTLDRPSSRVLPADFHLIETMRYDGGIALLEFHLERLRESADYFDIRFDEGHARDRIDAVRHGLAGAPHVVRLTLDLRGRVEVGGRPFDHPIRRTWRVRVSEHPIDSRDPFRYHKSSVRALYEQEWKRAVKDGFDDVLFLNERGEVAEGARSNVFIGADDTLYTPPLESGVLPGVLRRYLIETRGPGARLATAATPAPRLWFESAGPDSPHDAGEEAGILGDAVSVAGQSLLQQTGSVQLKTLYPIDLRRAGTVFCCNAVRGLIEAVVLVEEDVAHTSHL